jgi:hypothetical protein
VAWEAPAGEVVSLMDVLTVLAMLLEGQVFLKEIIACPSDL